MKKSLLSILLILLSFTTLSACGQTKEDVDQLVKDYVENKYGIEVTIVSKETINQVNLGDQRFSVKQNDELQLEFDVYLSGSVNPRIEGDTYFASKKSREYSQSFSEEHLEQLNLFNYERVDFSPSTASHNGYNLRVVTAEEISLNDDISLSHLLEFIELINTFDQEILIKENIDDLKITATKSDFEIDLNDLHTITSKDVLVKQLSKDSYLINKAIFEKDKPELVKLEEELKKLGYKYKNGVTLGQLTGSLLCLEQNVKGNKCVGGYEVNLEGPRDAESLFKMVQLLNQQKVKFRDAFLPGGDNPVKLEDLASITTIDQVKAILEK